MTPKRLISVSIMCADLLRLGEEIKKLEKSGVDYLHIDVMDAHFVPNLTFGPDFIKAFHRGTSIHSDIHLMVEDPALLLPSIEYVEGDIISVHSELAKDFTSMAAEIHSKGALFGIAVNPETPVDILEKYENIADVVLLMLVHPGFAGAKMVDGIMNKVAETRHWLDSRGHSSTLISVDGSVSCERAALMAGMGANIFVGGTSGIYRKGMDVEESVPEFRKAISI